MLDWIGNIISVVALGVSGLSLYVSRRTAQRAIDAEKVTAWIELHKTKPQRRDAANPLFTRCGDSRIGLRITPSRRRFLTPAAAFVLRGASRRTVRPCTEPAPGR
jgi:hypothetical protein